VDGICIGLNSRDRGISFADYSSILSGRLTTAGVVYSTSMYMSEYCKGNNRNRDDAQDNNGGQGEAKCDEFLHVSPFLPN